MAKSKYIKKVYSLVSIKGAENIIFSISFSL